MIFTDDFVARGALVSILMEGVAIPGDVKVVSLANKGLGPVYPVTLTRVENDPARHGEMLAEAVARFLVGRKVRDGNLAPEYIIGESFP